MVAVQGSPLWSLCGAYLWNFSLNCYILSHLQRPALQGQQLEKCELTVTSNSQQEIPNLVSLPAYDLSIHI